MEPPIFSAVEGSVTVTLRNRLLADVEDQVWLSLFGQHPMTVDERTALVLARREGSVTHNLWVGDPEPAARLVG